ncbi:hypothetical protein B0H16DRAFT_1464948 [Mycena metata]|uniref:Uncharacterized protein n=1 Tax=Mycena metata TaxID=1033252 RepID=A0AAD7MZW9_9AGAR|nr:hypothetical protein B0H16DRAFT_1464948 [Mycena metata]
MNLLRGLGAVYSRNTTTPELQRYEMEKVLVDDILIKALQFNAVVDFTTSNGTDIYGDSWTGPPSANFSGLNQTDALGALISALYLQNESTSTLSLSAPSPTSLASLVPTPLSHHGRSKIGAIMETGFLVRIFMLFGNGCNFSVASQDNDGYQLYVLGLQLEPNWLQPPWECASDLFDGRQPLLNESNNIGNNLHVLVTADRADLRTVGV